MTLKPFRLGAIAASVLLVGCGQDAAFNPDPISSPGPASNLQGSPPELRGDGCQAAGIDHKNKHEGTCVAADGHRFRVVNRGSVLRLRKVELSVLGTAFARSIAGAPQPGSSTDLFYLAKVRVKNRTHTKGTFRTDVISLLVGPGAVHPVEAAGASPG